MCCIWDFFFFSFFFLPISPGKPGPYPASILKWGTSTKEFQLVYEEILNAATYSQSLNSFSQLVQIKREDFSNFVFVQKYLQTLKNSFLKNPAVQ
jgi:hypothetical protein